MSELRVSIVVGAEDLASPEIRHVIGSLKALQSAQAEVAKSAAAPVPSKGIEDLGKSVRDTKEAVDSLAGTMQRLARIGTYFLAASVIYPVANALLAIPGRAIAMNAALETAHVTMTTLAGSTERANEMLTSLRRNADLTPYSTMELIDTGRALVHLSNQSTDTLMRLVRLAEVLATMSPEQGLQGAVFSLREAAAGDFTSLYFRQNVPRNLIQSLKDQGLSNIEVVEQAARQMGYTWQNVEQLGQTATGRWSTFVSTLDEVLQRIGAPTFDKLSKSLGETNVQVAESRDSLFAMADIVGNALPKGFELLVKYIDLMTIRLGLTKAAIEAVKEATGGAPNVVPQPSGRSLADWLAQNRLLDPTGTRRFRDPFVEAATAAATMVRVEPTVSPFGNAYQGVGVPQPDSAIAQAWREITKQTESATDTGPWIAMTHALDGVTQAAFEAAGAAAKLNDNLKEMSADKSQAGGVLAVLQESRKYRMQHGLPIPSIMLRAEESVQQELARIREKEGPAAAEAWLAGRQADLLKDQKKTDEATLDLERRQYLELKKIADFLLSGGTIPGTALAVSPDHVLPFLPALAVSGDRYDSSRVNPPPVRPTPPGTAGRGRSSVPDRGERGRGPWPTVPDRNERG